MMPSVPNLLLPLVGLGRFAQVRSLDSPQSRECFVFFLFLSFFFSFFSFLAIVVSPCRPNDLVWQLKIELYKRNWILQFDRVTALLSITFLWLLTPDSPADLHGMWYPPLRRALLCLSKLYRSVDRSTFQGLSQVWKGKFTANLLCCCGYF